MVNDTPPNMHHSNTFASSFWTPDYISGLVVLFDKLDQGVAENNQVLNFITARISLESAYASNLQTAVQENATSRVASAGFNRDEGASLKQGFEAFLEETKNQGIQHAHIAANLERLVRGPFSQYAESHKNRISSTRTNLTNMAKDYQKGVVNANKMQQSYFAKARQLEDNADPSMRKANVSSPLRQSLTASTIDERAEVTKPADTTATGSIELAGIMYTPEKFGTLLSSMLYSISRKTIRFSILGSYDNVSVGEDIVLWVRKYLSIKSLGEAEKFGQGLVDNGFIRLVGSVGSRFSGTTQSRYQWQPKAFEYSPAAAATEAQTASATSSPTSAHFSQNSMSKLTKVSGYISGLLPSNSQEEGKETDMKSHESQILKLQREIADVDQQYKDLVNALDVQRCKLEQSIIEGLTFMQQCERDRVKAVKTVLRDFSAAVAKTIEGLNESISRMALHEEFVDPLKDLDYLIERYKSGYYAPKPVVYDNFFNSTKIQSFGVDLKHSSHVVTSCIDYLTSPLALSGEDDKDRTLRGDEDFEGADNQSVASDGSEKTAVGSSRSSPDITLSAKYHRLSDTSKEILASLWAAQQSPLSEIQTLRNQINNGKEFDGFEVFTGVPLQVVISTLKEFLLELPDSIVTSTVYDIIKTTYTKSNDSAGVVETPEEVKAQVVQRVDRLVGLITHLPRVNITCLQTIFTHLAEICGLPESQDPDFNGSEPVPAAVQNLARTLAPYILRPRFTTALSMTDKHPAQFVQDMILHRVRIFEETQARLNQRSQQRSERSASVSKANRRSLIEARNKAIVAMSHTSSSSASTSGHRSQSSVSSTPRSPSPVIPPPVISSGKLLPLTLSPASRKKY